MRHALYGIKPVVIAKVGRICYTYRVYTTPWAAEFAWAQPVVIEESAPFATPSERRRQSYNKQQAAEFPWVQLVVMEE